MDKDYVMSLLQDRDDMKDPRLINRGDYIDASLYQMLKEADTKHFNRVFKRNDDILYIKHTPYRVEVMCKECGRLFIAELSKTAICKSFSGILCDECKAKQELAKVALKEKQDEYYRNLLDMRTQNFIDTLFSPKELVHIQHPSKIFKEYVDDAKIKELVNSLSYEAFLGSAYWECIRLYKLKQAGYSCSLCNSKKGLNVHHRTYTHHGLEHKRIYADQDLIVLCKDCHAKFHGKGVYAEL